MTLAALGIEAKTDGVEKATDELNKLAGAAGKAETATEQLPAATKKAGDGAKKLGDEARTADGSLAKMAAGAGRVVGALAAMALAAVSVGGLFALVRRGADDMDAVAKSARRVGGTATGFRAMELAAGEAGVAVSTLADAVQSMDREIAKNSAGANDALKRLGITAKALSGLDVDAKLALVSDQIKAMGLSSGEASVVLQGFGIRNKEMILAVQNGGDAFREARKDIEDYGLGISAIQTDVIEEANDRIGRLGVIGQYAGQQLSLVLTPAIGAMAVAMTDSLREGGLLRSMIDGLVSVVKFGAENFGMIATVIGVMASTAIPAAVGGLVALTSGFTAAGIAAGVMGKALALAGGPIGLAVAAATALGIAIYSAWQPAKSTAETLNTLAAAQDEVTRATKAFNAEMTTNSVNAMVKAAEANIGIIQNEIELTKKAWQSANTWRMSLGPNDGMIAASEKIVMLQEAMAMAESVLAEKRAQAAAFVEQQVAGVVHLNEEQQKALQSANEMTRSFEQRAALSSIEAQYGRESAQYMQEQLNQERQIQFAKIAALDITNQQKAAARQAYDQMVMTEAATNGWNVKLGTVNTSLSAAYQYLIKIRDTQPGSGWLATAISKAAGLAATLWDAVAANGALSNLSVSGPADDDERGSQRRIVHDATRYTRDNPLAAGVGGTGAAGGGGGGGGGGGEVDPAIDALKRLNQEYTDLQATIGMTAQQQSVYNAIQSLGATATQSQKDEVANLVTSMDTLKSKMEMIKQASGEMKNAMSGAFVGLVTGAKTLKSAISDLLSKFAEMLASRAFDMIWDSGLGKGVGGFLGSIFGGIGSNAMGTNNWRGGLTSVNERGGEIMNLPRGTQIIPHDISKRMADRAGGGGSVEIVVRSEPGTVVEIARNEAGAVFRQGIQQYDSQALPTRVQQIQSDPRRRG